MKKYITIAALFAAGTAFANAGVAYIDFGNKLGDSDADLELLNGTVNPTLLEDVGLSVSGSIANVGQVGNVNFKLPSLSTEAAEYFGSADQKIWGDEFNSNNQGNNNLSLTFTGLQANTTYTIALLSGIGGVGQPSFFNACSGLNLTYGEVVSGTAFIDSASEGESFETYYGTGSMQNKQDLFVWEFKTGASIADNASFTLEATTGTYNAISISTAPIPEPSAFGLLAGIGALALVASRRRRK